MGSSLIVFAYLFNYKWQKYNQQNQRTYGEILIMYN